MWNPPDLGHNTLQSPTQSSSPELTTAKHWGALGPPALASLSLSCLPASGGLHITLWILGMETPQLHPGSFPASSLLATMLTPQPHGGSSRA